MGALQGNRVWRRTEPAQLVREYNTAGVGLRDAAAVSGVRRHITGAVPCVHTLWWLLLVRLAPLHTGGCRGSRGRRQEGGVRDGKRSTLFFSACGLADTAVRTLSSGILAKIRPTHTIRGRHTQNPDLNSANVRTYLQHFTNYRVELSKEDMLLNSSKFR